MIIVTHDPFDAISLADRIVFFDSGKIKAVVKREELSIRLRYPDQFQYSGCFYNEDVL